MPTRKKTWHEKLEDAKDLPRVAPIPERLRATWGRGTLVIAAPSEVDELMQRVPKGKLATVNDLRAALASRHGAAIACPMTTGIFALIAARAADEDERAGKKRVTPYWRTLKGRGELNEKYPGGIAAQRARLEAEGHAVVARGKKWVVLDYEERLARLI